MSKFCGNCGAMMDDNDRVCGECGTVWSADGSTIPPAPTGSQPQGGNSTDDVSFENLEGTEISSSNTQGSKQPSGPQEDKKKTGIRKALPIIIVVAVILIVIIIIAATRPSKINLNKYMSIETEGYDGYGRAVASFDYDQFENDWGSKLKYKSDWDYLFWLPVEQFEYEIIDGYLDVTSGLSNGDKVTYIWNCNDDLAKSLFGVKLKYSDITEKVKDLDKIEEFDPFDNVSVTYSGVNGYGTADVYAGTRESYMSEFTFTCSSRSNGSLSNGDEITVTAEVSYYIDDMADYFSATYGMIPSVMEKTYVVEGLEETTEFDPFSHITVTFSGYDGYGTVSLDVDTQYDYMNEFNFTLTDQNSGSLSNGDSIVVAVTVPAASSNTKEYFAKTYGIVPSSTSKTYSVNGLAEPEEFDPFDYVDVKFSGISSEGYAEVTVDTSVSFMDGVEASISDNDKLSIGDTVTVTLSEPYWADSSLEQYWINEYGYKADSVSKTYTVNGLGHYVTTLDEISDELLEEMKTQAEDAFLSYIANRWIHPDDLYGYTFLGCYLLTSKDIFDTNYENVLYLVYSFDATLSEEEYDYTYYSFARFDNVVRNADGSCSVDLSDYLLADNNYYPISTRWLVYGYGTMAELYNNCVTSNLEKYNYESSVEGG